MQFVLLAHGLKKAYPGRPAPSRGMQQKLAIALLALTLNLLVLAGGPAAVYRGGPPFPAGGASRRLGAGNTLGALALYFKRIQAFLDLFMFLVMTPFERLEGPLRTLGLFLPIASAAGVLRDPLAREAAFEPGAFLVALAGGFGYLLLGLFFFVYVVRLTKRRGLLGGY